MTSRSKNIIKQNRKPSLLFIHAVNFELTYHCNLHCSHCLQQEIRKTVTNWISTNSVKKALEDIHSVGFTPIGINFTGGEIFLPESNLPELINTARSLKLDVRVNTNGWWGNQTNINIGDMQFKSVRHVVGWLRDLGVAILALSFDQRYVEKKWLWDSVASIIRECEQQGQYYQIICTGVTTSEIYNGWYRLTEDEGINPIVSYLLKWI